MSPHVHHLALRAERLDLAAAHDEVAALARQPGLLSLRLYRDRQDPARLLAVHVWGSRDEATRGAVFAADRVEAAREYALLDFVWGRRGPANFLRPGTGFAQHLITHVLPGKLAAWTPYRRNCASVMARQTGVTSYEIMQDLADPTLFLVLRGWESTAHGGIMMGGTTAYRPNEEIRYVTRPATDLRLYEGALPVVYTDCDLVAGAFGPGGAERYARWMETLEPV